MLLFPYNKHRHTRTTLVFRKGIFVPIRDTARVLFHEAGQKGFRLNKVEMFQMHCSSFSSITQLGRITQPLYLR